MKRLVIGAAAAAGAVFAVRQLAHKGREMHDQCRELMRDRCGHATPGCRPA